MVVMEDREMEAFISSIVSNVYSLLVWSPVITAAVSIFFGLMWCFFGYRAFRPLLVATTAMLGILLAFGISAHVSPNPVVWGVGSAIGGLLGGVMGHVFVYVSIFLMGVSFSTAATMVLFLKVLKFSWQSSVFGSMMIGLVGGLLALLVMRPMLVLTTSLTGTGLVVATVIALVVAVPALDGAVELSNIYSVNLAPFLTRFWPAITTCALLLFSAGLLFQFTWGCEEKEEKVQPPESKPARKAKAA